MLSTAVRIVSSACTVNKCTTALLPAAMQALMLLRVLTSTAVAVLCFMDIAGSMASYAGHTGSSRALRRALVT
jgi:hypothetical protein